MGCTGTPRPYQCPLVGPPCHTAQLAFAFRRIVRASRGWYERGAIPYVSPPVTFSVRQPVTELGGQHDTGHALDVAHQLVLDTLLRFGPMRWTVVISRSVRLSAISRPRTWQKASSMSRRASGCRGITCSSSAPTRRLKASSTRAGRRTGPEIGRGTKALKLTGFLIHAFRLAGPVPARTPAAGVGRSPSSAPTSVSPEADKYSRQPRPSAIPGHGRASPMRCTVATHLPGGAGRNAPADPGARARAAPKGGTGIAPAPRPGASRAGLPRRAPGRSASGPGRAASSSVASRKPSVARI